MDISSTSKGVLIPRLTTAQRNAIVSPANGLMIYNSTTKQYNFYNGTRWQMVSALPKETIILSTKYDDADIKNEGFSYNGFLKHEVVSQVIGDSTFAANAWYRGNAHYTDNTGAPECSASPVTVLVDSFLYSFSSDSVFIYSRNSDTWRGLPVNNSHASGVIATASDYYRVANQVVIWSMASRAGVRYNYASDIWDTVNTVNSPLPREFCQSVNTGAEIIFWGGRYFDVNTSQYVYPAEGYRYSPLSNTWSVIPAPSGYPGRIGFAMAFSGNGFLLWGGFRVHQITGTMVCNGAFPATTLPYSYDSTSYYTDGRFYNMNTNSWQTVPQAGSPSGRQGAAVVYDGSDIVITGGRYKIPAVPACAVCFPAFNNCIGYTTYSDLILKSGAKYSPLSNTWLSMPDAPRPFADVYPIFDNDQYMTLFIGDDTTITFEPSANDWFINFYPALNPAFVSQKHNSFALAAGDFVILKPDGGIYPIANFSCLNGRKAVYNYRPQQVIFPAVKSEQVMPAVKFYLYKKE
ncbi:MAG: hypothetical protein QM687_06285 [Ferruginibacter sp.]